MNRQEGIKGKRKRNQHRNDERRKHWKPKEEKEEGK